MCVDYNVVIKDGEIYYPPQGKIYAFMFDYLNGKENHYPLCCILRFALESAFLDGRCILEGEGQARKRGVIVRANNSVFVPCNIFHRKTHALEDEY